MKLGRTYVMTVEVASAQLRVPTPGPVRHLDGGAGTIGVGQTDNAVLIGFPLTLTFDIKRDTLSSANTGRFRIYNLDQGTRNQIFHDRNDTTNYKRLVLNAGYVDEPRLPIIFHGNIVSAYSWREGVNWVTEIEAFDGGFGRINSQVNQTFPSGYSLESLATALIKTIQNVTIGAIGDFSAEQSSRGVTLSGNSWDILRDVFIDKAETFIDEEQVFILKPNEYLKLPANAFSKQIAAGDADQNAFVVSALTGLLGTPRRYDARVDINMIFEPQVKVGMLIKLESSEKMFSGVYKVIGVTHRGQISGAFSGDCITTLNLQRYGVIRPVAYR